MQFQLQKQDSQTKARTGLLETDHGSIRTPIFMPVGTAGSVKAVHQRELAQDIDAQIILGNTYHLYLRPGMQVMEKAGGLHPFMNWSRPILTDSGGYQVYSLSERRKISEEGVAFRSHIDGSRHFFSPEQSMEIQRKIGANVIMAFDECPPYPCDYSYARKSMELTHRWLARSAAYLQEHPSLYGHSQALFPIVQGSTYADLRKHSASVAAEYGTCGIAIGGLSVGEPAEEMYAMSELVCDQLPTDQARYLMGVGTPANLLENIALGLDMFDCVMPTRNGRNGMIFTSEGIINLKNQKWSEDFSPLDPQEITFVDHTYSRAYLRHLFKAKEYLGQQVASIHNLGFYLWLVGEARRHIEMGDFGSWKNEMIPRLSRRL